MDKTRQFDTRDARELAQLRQRLIDAERKAETARAHLDGAIYRLVSYTDATITEVADAAGLSRQSVYAAVERCTPDDRRERS